MDESRANHIKVVTFKKVFKKYFPSLCVFANKIVGNEDAAKDVVQDVFYKLWKASASFPNEKAMKAYLYLATKNTSLDYLKAKDRSHLKYIDSYHEEVLSDYTISLEFIREETYRLLDEAIEKLPVKSKKIIRLSMKGYTNMEIAEQLQISINTVKTQKLIAYRKIRTYIDTHIAMMLIMHMHVWGHYLADV